MKRKIIISLSVLILLIAGILIFCDQTVAFNAKGQLYDSVDSIPHRKVGLILGTSPTSTYHHVTTNQPKEEMPIGSITGALLLHKH